MALSMLLRMNNPDTFALPRLKLFLKPRLFDCMTEPLERSAPPMPISIVIDPEFPKLRVINGSAPRRFFISVASGSCR